MRVSVAGIFAEAGIVQAAGISSGVLESVPPASVFALALHSSGTRPEAGEPLNFTLSIGIPENVLYRWVSDARAAHDSEGADS